MELDDNLAKIRGEGNEIYCSLLFISNVHKMYLTVTMKMNPYELAERNASAHEVLLFR